jgi:hypothetical protein
MLDQVLALASRKESVFGRATGRFRTPQDAPAPSLVGRAVSDLPVHRDVAPSAEGTFDSQGPALMADPASGFVPARPSGTVRWEGMPDRLPLAIAVNGTVRATTWTLHSRNPERPWSAMVPADAFTHGRNRLELYVVDEHGGRVRLLAKTE